MQWSAPKHATLFVNGVKQVAADSKITLSADKFSLLFEVSTDSTLPCIIFNGGGLEKPNDWQVSMDKVYWTIPESAGMYNKPAVLPDAAQEVAVELKPVEILPVRNAVLKGADGVTVGKNGYVLVDFFHLETGMLTFSAKGRGTLTVRVGETPEEPLPWSQRRSSGSWGA